MLKKIGVLLTGLLVLIIVFTSLNPSKPELDVILAQTEVEKPMDQQEVEPLRIALGTGISPESNIEYYWTLVQYIEQKIGRKVEVVQRKSYAEINYLLSLNLVDVAFICSSSYILAGETTELDLLAVPKINGVYEYQSFIIVRSDSTLKEFKDLRGKSFAFSDPMSTTGFYYTAHRLGQLDSNPDQYFSSFFFSYSHDNSIQAVISGLADAAAVDSTVFNKVLRSNPEIIEQIRIIEKSPKFINSPIVARADLAPDIKDKLVNLFITVDQDEEAKQIFKQFGIDGYSQEVQPGDYEPIRQMIKEVRRKI